MLTVGVGCDAPACADGARVGGGEGDGDLRAPSGVVGIGLFELQRLTPPSAADFGGPAFLGAVAFVVSTLLEAMASKQQGWEIATAQGAGRFGSCGICLRKTSVTTPIKPHT